jgi:hypothetical protein
MISKSKGNRVQAEGRERHQPNRCVRTKEGVHLSSSVKPCTAVRARTVLHETRNPLNSRDRSESPLVLRIDSIEIVEGVIAETAEPPPREPARASKRGRIESSDDPGKPFESRAETSRIHPEESKERS